MRDSHDRLHMSPVIRAELSASLLAPRQARVTVRHALNAGAWTRSLVTPS